MAIHTQKIQLGAGTLEIETGKFAKLADGAVTVRLGDTIVLVTAVSATKVKDGQDFFPLSVEYKEKASAAGRFPGGYFKREGRPTEKEILTCRMTDRPLRPLFPKGYYYDTQVVAILLSADGENDPDICAMNGASAALCVSDIPFAGPVGAVRIGRINGEFVINPTQSQRLDSDLDLVYVGNKTDVIMIEGAANELPEAEFVKALHFAQNEVTKIVAAQEELTKLAGKTKREVPLMLVKDELLEIAYAVAGDRIESALYTPSKVARGKAVGALKDEVEAAIKAKFPEATGFEISQAFDYLQKKAFRISILDKKNRCDGRGIDQLRPLSGEASVLPRTHGSASFTRGETMALSIATLAPADEAQEMDTYAGGPDTKRFILHYNFPPFSVGETGRFGGQNRREIGHGALAERSIEPVIPPKETFPYAIRVSSEVMESNGSTSMASVCSGVMALLDAGVPIKRPVGGISVGLVTEFEGDNMKRYLTMLDIIGSEDHFGDMDFKLCGTSEGVTGYQLDLKLPGIPLSILEEAIVKAKEGRTQVLSAMAQAIAEVKPLSPYAPRIEIIKINPDKIGELIGPGGKNIKAIQAESGAEISIEDDGTVYVYASRKEGIERAVEMISGTSQEIEVGKTYTGRVVSTTNFGAFMNLGGKKDGLIHISELADFRVNKTEDVVKTGDVVTAKCIGIDDKGRIKMSRKAAMKEKDAAAKAEAEGAATPAA
ncbi:polyribonucleotide nucleotidyltransferase [Prosthecobacter vanneervenii]|uniref:Polyribonucleotide nucleotidyltransferase n=1 Tax=Prosthecobacter vanneervenii TaxID=48466 RepID=A0A7W7Y9K7_9BACT|nr:polyribonucleotide nucleotidyltransferase [Prosthecobacter vanneervenii]MBB5032158.1 polyribonucleotide nucleotidyltransferase [Prosthecobacter vanneervenii]